MSRKVENNCAEKFWETRDLTTAVFVFLRDVLPPRHCCLCEKVRIRSLDPVLCGFVVLKRVDTPCFGVVARG